MNLQHLILSHHGKLEYGSPKLPMMPEADILSKMDSMDCYQEMFAMLLYLTDDFLRAGTAVCPEAIYTDFLRWCSGVVDP